MAAEGLRAALSSTSAAGTAGTMSKPSRRLAGALAPDRHLRDDDIADVVGVAQPEDHAVGDLARRARSIAGGEGGDVDRQVGPRVEAGEVEAGAPLLARRRVLAAQDRAHDRHVLAHLGDGLVDRLPVPALDDRPVRDAEPEGEAPAGELVDRRGRLGHRRRRARVDRDDAGPDADPRRVASRRRSGP